MNRRTMKLQNRESRLTYWLRLEDRVTPATLTLLPTPYFDPGSEPEQLTEGGPAAFFFVANEGTNGRELWRSTGFSATLVRDINPGSADSSIQNLTDIGNGVVYFTANNSTNGNELWRSNGTSTGTFMVRDITAGSAGTLISDPVNVGGTLFFRAVQSGIEGLWKSDGTSTGTVLVRAVDDIDSMVNVNGTVYFRTGTFSNQSIWKSNGTSAGTTLVTPTNFGRGDMINVNGTLYFTSGQSTQAPTGIFKSDGTSSGTIQIPGIVGTPKILANIGSTLYFSAEASSINDTTVLWSTDGVTTKQLTSVPASGPAVNANGMLLFMGETTAAGQELWKSDGTSAGTALLRDLIPGASSSQVSSLTVVGSTTFFKVNSQGVANERLWRTDGTSAGTIFITNIVHLYGSYYDEKSLLNFNGTLVFSGENNSVGNELWRSDGTSSGTRLIENIYDGPGIAASDLTNLNGSLFFSSDTNGTDLSRAIGLTTNQLSSGGSPKEFTNVNGTLYFSQSAFGSPVVGRELYRRDASSNVLVRDISPGVGNSDPQDITPVGVSQFFFTAFDSSTGRELWISDGTSTGTTLVRDIIAGATGSSPTNLTNVNGTLYFTVNTAADGLELWRSNGTSTGTFMVRDINPGAAGSGITNLVNLANTLLFRANDGSSGFELWRSDGTSTGTTIVADIASGSGSSNPGFLTNVNGFVYFSASTGIGSELWRSNGTSTGTTLVRDIRAGGYGSYPANLTNVSGTLYFSANNGTTGTELWKSNGTSTGTSLVRDIWPGFTSSYPQELTSAFGSVYFRADNGSSGYELWESDGTSAGTQLVEDINPGTFSSSPNELTQAGTFLYLTAVNGGGVRQLYALSAGTNNAPTITTQGGGALATYSFPENRTFIDTLTASDPEGATLTWSIVGGADAARFTINPSTGSLSFLTAPDFELPTDNGANNIYELIIGISDGSPLGNDTDTIGINVSITNVNPTQSTVYLDDGWIALAAGTVIPDADPSLAGSQPGTIGTNAFGTLPIAADHLLSGGTIVMLPGTYPQKTRITQPFNLKVTGNSTVSGVLSGAFILEKQGNGALTLSGANTLVGGFNVSRGTLRVASDLPFGPAGNAVTTVAPGEVELTASHATSRTFNLGSGMLTLNSGVTLTSNGATFSGGFLRGSGTITSSTFTTFAANTVGNTLTVNLDGSDTVQNLTNSGTVIVPVSERVEIDGFAHEAAGKLIVNGELAVFDFISYGMITINDLLSNGSTSPLVFAGGVTTVAAAGELDIASGGAFITGALVKNSGIFNGTGTITVDYLGRVQGTGTFGSVVTQNGGIFAPGSSPGTASTHQLNINGGGRLEFEITNATGTAGNVSGWDLVQLSPNTVSAAPQIALTSTPASRYTILLASRVNDGLGNTPGLAANFNPAQSYAWKFANGVAATTSGSFDSNAFTIDTSGFSNSFTGGFGVELRDGGKNLYIVYTPVAGPMVTGIVVNNGDTQRSRLTTIQVNFAAPVDAATLQSVGAITLTRTAATSNGTLGTIVDSGNGLIVAPVTGMVSSVTLTFANTSTAGINFASLADGRWQLAIPSASYTSPLNDPILRRLFGDFDNNGTVDATDFSFFPSFGAASNSPFDFNNNGDIDSGTDFAQFGNRVGLTL